jgi:hypothetical protein
LDADNTPVKHDDLMADVNAHVHELAERLDPADDDAAIWGFRCECGAPGCRARAELSLSAYEALRRRGDPVLAPGHLPTAPAA